MRAKLKACFGPTSKQVDKRRNLMRTSGGRVVQKGCGDIGKNWGSVGIVISRWGKGNLREKAMQDV